MYSLSNKTKKKTQFERILRFNLTVLTENVAELGANQLVDKKKKIKMLFVH